MLYARNVGWMKVTCIQDKNKVCIKKCPHYNITENFTDAIILENITFRSGIRNQYDILT